jgi:hypothetical protein
MIQFYLWWELGIELAMALTFSPMRGHLSAGYTECRRSIASLIAMSFRHIWCSPSLMCEQTKESARHKLSLVACCSTFCHIGNFRSNKEVMFDV